ncbi:alpha/beta fold hydrolase [Marimonas lutisalis]|uniref:alpha/beta fold hydrolase n=1 Tax=Marimonas lutisalis TaxID=2545756 RepID=UPI001375EF97|nr:alpha/beta fold hydrolase [Marimonas lutisalis]
MFQAEDRFIDVDGVRTRYWAAGDRGSPVVLVHGIACVIEHWEQNFEALSKHHRVFALDLVGCGLSDKHIDFDYSFGSLASFVLDFMSAVGLEKAHLIGFSLGGNLVLRCAAQAPERVLSVVTADPACVGPKLAMFLRLAKVRGLGELLTWPSRFGTKSFVKSAFVDGSVIATMKIDRFTELARQPGAQAAFLKMLRSDGSFSDPCGTKQLAEIQSLLPKVCCRVQVIWGRQDAFVPANHADILKQLLPQCELVLYEDCGHLPQIEQQAKFDADVLRFIERPDEGGQRKTYS